MPTDELGGGVNYDVGSMFEWSDEDWRESVVDNKDNAVAVGDCGDAFYVEDITIRVAERLSIDDLGVWSDGGLDSDEVIDVDDSIADALARESVSDEVVGASIDVVGSYDVVASESNILKGVGDSCGTRSDSESSDTALKSGDALLEGALSGIGQTTIDVASIA